jgi:hypothetical protein
MKKISLIALALSAGTLVFSQTQPKLRTDMAVTTRFGIKAGANLAKLNDDGFSGAAGFDSKNKTSFNAGLFANIPISTNFRFQPEVVYSNQGGKNNINTATPTGSVTTRYKSELNYINVPLMLQLQSTSGVFVELGPQFGYLLSAKNKNTDNSTSGNTEVDIKDQLKKWDIAAAGGIGYLSRIGLGLNARYNYSFTNILDKNYSGYTAGQELKNRVYQVGLFYQFGAAK